MSGQQQQGPSAGKIAGGIGTTASLISPFLPKPAADIVKTIGGVAGMAKNGPAADPGKANPLGFVGSTAGTLGTITGMMGPDNKLLSSVFGGMKNVVGMATGTMTALDSDKGAEERILGGADAVGSGLGLWGSLGGFSLSAAGGTSVGTLAAAGGATAAGAAGAVLGAGVAGYKAGSMLNDIANSDYARSSIWGKDQYTGKDRTANDALIDTMVNLNLGADEMGRNANKRMDAAGASAGNWINEKTGTQFLGNAVSGAMDYAGGAVEGVMDYGGGILGGAGAAIGSIGTTALGVGTAAKNWVGSWFD